MYLAVCAVYICMCTSCEGTCAYIEAERESEGPRYLSLPLSPRVWCTYNAVRRPMLHCSYMHDIMHRIHFCLSIECIWARER